MKHTQKSAATGSKSARSQKNHTQPEQEEISKVAVPPSRVNPVSAINQVRPDESSILRERKRLFLGVGDEVRLSRNTRLKGDFDKLQLKAQR